MITGIRGDELPAVIDRVSPFLEHFAARDLKGETVEGLTQAIRERDMQLWVIGAFQAVALTQVTRDAVHITHCAGTRREDWQEAFDDHMRAWAKRLGKARVVATVRPGWARFGKARGYLETHREMAVEV